MIPSFVGPSSGQGGCLRELWSSTNFPLFRGCSIWRRPWEYNEPPFLFFFFFFFFWWLWCLGFLPPQLLPNGGVACVVATCHARIGWGVLSSNETFQFSHVFWGASFLKPLCSFFGLTFSKFQSSVFIAPNPSAFFVLYYCDFCAHPLDFSISLSFSGTPLCFSCSFFPFEVLFASFFCALFPFWTLLFYVSFLMDYSNIRRTSPFSFLLFSLV